MEDLAPQAKYRSSYITQHKGVALRYFEVFLITLEYVHLCMTRVKVISQK